MANEVTLQSEEKLHPVDENIRPIKVGGKTTSLEIAQSGDGARVSGNLEVSGNIPDIKTDKITSIVDEDDSIVFGASDLSIFSKFIKIQDTVAAGATVGGILIDAGGSFIKISNYDDLDDYFQIVVLPSGATPLSTVDDGAAVGHLTLNVDGDVILDPHSGITKFYKAGDTDDLCTLTVGINGATTIATNDSDGILGNLVLDADGDIKLDANGGNITLLAGGSTYTPTASSDAVPLSHMPFVLYSQFQDDLGTAKHYLPLKGYFEQNFVGQEPTGMIAPFNMKLQKAIMRCSENVSGGDFKIGMWALDSGTDHDHHHTTGFNWIEVTGGAIDANATFDFTGTVGLAASASGGSNAVTAGQWIDFAIQSDTDVTTSNAEFWITFFFIADLSNTI